MCTGAWINERSHQWRPQNPYSRNWIGDVVAKLHTSGETFRWVANSETSSFVPITYKWIWSTIDTCTCNWSTRRACPLKLMGILMSSNMLPTAIPISGTYNSTLSNCVKMWRGDLGGTNVYHPFWIRFTSWAVSHIWYSHTYWTIVIRAAYA